MLVGPPLWAAATDLGQLQPERAQSMTCLGSVEIMLQMQGFCELAGDSCCIGIFEALDERVGLNCPGPTLETISTQLAMGGERKALSNSAK